MRRLPIYFLIDVSESMVGEPISQVEEGISTIIQALKTDPTAIETVWISIIAFAGKARTLLPLQDIISFYPPKYPIGSGTSLSSGLRHLMTELDQNIKKTSATSKGDWKPIIFLFTDGVPTDDTAAAIAEWKQKWQRQSNLVAVSFGSEANTGLLSQLTEHVLFFKNADLEAYKYFFKWITASITTTSVKIESHGSGIELEKVDNDKLSKIDLTKSPPAVKMVDDNFVVLLGKCQESKRHYLIKFKKQMGSNSWGDLTMDTRAYLQAGAYAVKETYFELSDSNVVTNHQINTAELIGTPTCPCCSNQSSLARCSCGKIHCIGFEELNTCPWCGNTARYRMMEDGGGFDVSRTQG